jgi:uncharacterized protein CbrC (UPF0167 family)
MKSPKNKDGDHVAVIAALCVERRAKTETLDALADLSNWLQSRWLRHYVLFCSLGAEIDREQMARLGRFVDALKEVRS